MLGRETGRDDRQRDERGRGRERLREGLPFAAALLAAVLLEALQNDAVKLPGSADERATAATRLRERATADGSDTGWTTDRLGLARSVARDGRLRKGAPLAAVILAGLLFRGRRDDEASTGGTSNRQTGALDAVTRVRSRAPTAGTDRTGVDETTDRADASGATERPDSTRSEPVSSGDVGTGSATAETDANVDDLSAPTTRGMPMLGVGTYRRADYDECFESVRQALRTGYRHVDTTDRRSAYYAEEAVGDAVARSEVDREEVFVATKVTPADLDHDHVRTSAEESLDRLGMDYVDLLYVHWPTHDYEPHETLDAFARLREDGLVERIGVSNFTVDLLDEALEVADAPIFANQVEMHPLLPQADLREFCERAGVEIVAYSPIARGDVEDVAELQEVAAEHGATPEQVSLAWLREKGVAAIPRATSEDHLRENWRSLALDLDAEDVAKLDSIEERRRIVDPDDAPWNS